MSGQNFKKKGSQWEVFYSKGSGKNRIRKKAIFSTRKEGQAWIEELVLKYENGNSVRKQMLLCEYFDYWFKFEKKNQ